MPKAREVSEPLDYSKIKDFVCFDCGAWSDGPNGATCEECGSEKVVRR